ncbi:MAG: hypothetical protein ABIG96_04385 [Candidatus Micrarchaeota archaeon]
MLQKENAAGLKNLFGQVAYGGNGRNGNGSSQRSGLSAGKQERAQFLPLAIITNTILNVKKI